MKKLILLLALVMPLSGCVGLAVGTFGTFETKVSKPDISEERNQFDYKIEAPTFTKEALVNSWGEADEIIQDGVCEVLIYHDGYSWSGVGAFVVVVPIPLLVPSGYDENRFYFKDGYSVGLIKEYGEVTSALGYMCGSNECKFLSGTVNTEKTKKVEMAECHDSTGIDVSSTN
ncbi:hypothetical protein [Thalassotalea mangrovi]|uniref:Lipoprotein n=1 Tax=Thalassotalea mangrovi TaxID=2572245 RepID=A0A4U1B4J7_9GAMM|nr:hypothetical protein [Thalassotalea mangrovi]TKB45164.1 hypothetical protein E8M12_10080 [Thalassotalea mangrovi]